MLDVVVVVARDVPCRTAGAADDDVDSVLLLVPSGREVLYWRALVADWTDVAGLGDSAVVDWIEAAVLSNMPWSIKLVRAFVSYEALLLTRVP